jgi:hypothetical protein
MNRLKEFLMMRYEEGSPATYADAWDFLEQQCRMVVPLDTLRRNIERMREFRVIKGISMEKERVEASPEEMYAYVNETQNIIMAQGIPAGIVVNIDEAGHQSWQNSHAEKVVVPTGYPNAAIPIPVQRNEKRVTLLGRVAADGDMLQPIFIVPRVTIDRELLLLAGCHLHIVYQLNGFVTTELFEEWCTTVLFPYFSETRRQLGYDRFGLLILDVCSCHTSEGFLEACLFNGIVPVLLPAHSSDQLRPLDLGIFAFEKTEAKPVRPGTGVNPQTVQVLKILNSYRKAAICTNNVISVFVRSGIEPYVRDIYAADEKTLIGFVTTVRVNREKARKVRHWKIEGKRINVRDNHQLMAAATETRPTTLDLLASFCGTDDEGADWVE